MQNSRRIFQLTGKAVLWYTIWNMKVVVTDYNPLWPAMFEDEAQRIAAVLGDQMTELHHIGSTAVPGLAAKPVIDCMPVVRDVAAVDRLNVAFEALG